MEGEKVEIRVGEATEDDISAFATFFWQAWEQAGPEAEGFVGASDQVISELTAPEVVRERIGGPDRRMFLAWDRERVVGFAATKRVDAKTVELAGIIVLESSSGRGVGSRLVEAAIRRAQAEGYLGMVVRTEITNQRARAFYETRGFTVDGSTFESVEGEMVEVWELTRTVT